VAKKFSFYFNSNNCQCSSNDFERIVPDKYYYLRPCGRVIIAMAADDITYVNFGFKQFMTAAGIHAATNPL